MKQTAEAFRLAASLLIAASPLAFAAAEEQREPGQRPNREEFRERFEQRQRELQNLSPEAREARIKEWREQAEKRIQELREKKKAGKLSEDEERQLDRMEQFQKQGGPRPGVGPRDEGRTQARGESRAGSPPRDGRGFAPPAGERVREGARPSEGGDVRPPRDERPPGAPSRERGDFRPPQDGRPPVAGPRDEGPGRGLGRTEGERPPGPMARNRDDFSPPRGERPPFAGPRGEGSRDRFDRGGRGSEFSPPPGAFRRPDFRPDDERFGPPPERRFGPPPGARPFGLMERERSRFVPTPGERPPFAGPPGERRGRGFGRFEGRRQGPPPTGEFRRPEFRPEGQGVRPPFEGRSRSFGPRDEERFSPRGAERPPGPPSPDRERFQPSRGERPPGAGPERGGERDRFDRPEGSRRRPPMDEGFRRPGDL